MLVFECLNQIIIHVRDTQTHPFIVKDSLIYFISEQNYRQKEICSSRIKKKETIYKSINGYQFVILENSSKTNSLQDKHKISTNINTQNKIRLDLQNNIKPGIFVHFHLSNPFLWTIEQPESIMLTYNFQGEQGLGLSRHAAIKWLNYTSCNERQGLDQH